MPVIAHVVIYDDAAEKVTDTPEMRSLLARIARDALGEAAGSAPVYSGHYAASLASSLDERAKTPTAKLEARNSFWHFVEFGALSTPPYHVLENAVRAQGVRYEAVGAGQGDSGD